MGDVKVFLAKGELPERESHNSRMFIDLAENIHIHYREYRNVFSLDEYFEYADIVAKSTEDVRNYLAQNPEYKESTYPDLLQIAGGRQRIKQYLKNSPAPNKSKYYNNDFAIELQDEKEVDEIHFHYRDFRIAMNRNTFKVVAKKFNDALTVLYDFENNNTYTRTIRPEHVRKIYQYNGERNEETQFMGSIKVGASDIFSNWYYVRDDWNSKGEFNWHPYPETINALIKDYKDNGRFKPIILSTEEDGKHFIVDGHHRFYVATKLLCLEEIDAVVLDLTFDQTEDLRSAETLIKKFDKETKHKYNMITFMQFYLSCKLNRHYEGSFNKKLRGYNFITKSISVIKRVLKGNKNIIDAIKETKLKVKK